MKNKFTIVSIFTLAFCVFTAFINSENPYFIITKKDVELKIPKGFPKPIYKFKLNQPTPEGFILGRKLFYDPILSKDSSISCGSCHQRIAAFAHIDHTLSHGINGLIGNRNVPPIQNMIWQTNFMWDGGINHLDLQPIAPITNAIEMNENLKHVIQKLQCNNNYKILFNRAFYDTIITSEKMLKAISQFVGLMISANSRYDKFMRKEDTLSQQELNGLKLFRLHCAACHKEPLFTDNTFRNNGLLTDTSLKDFGRFAITGLEKDKMKFKVPSLRNIEMTYPYMHDGRFRNLKQVVNHYAKGIFLNETDELIRKINLSEKDQVDIISFLKTLTDKTFLYDIRFAEPL